MSELNPTTPTVTQSPAPTEPWSPSGVIITSLVAGVALFFALSILILVVAVGAVTMTDIPH
jgi:hypothetical protein